VVGLVNNMSDGALLATESQFCGLAQEASPPHFNLEFRYFSLDELERGDIARAHMFGRYAPIDELFSEGVDALIVTGAEPRAATFEEEPYWASLARIIDWTEAQRIPTVWSCLAAHAAVWRLHGVGRIRLADKHSGVFALQSAEGSPWLADAPAEMYAPHSRLNDLNAEEVEAAGFDILARSPEVGVDTFVKHAQAPSMFFQGHPEYDAGALGREYLRDLSRFTRGQQVVQPSIPTGYFDGQTLDVLRDLSNRAPRARDPDLLAQFALAVEHHAPRASWRPWALHVYRTWFHLLDSRVLIGRTAARRAARSLSAPANARE
jgi:homoserine O-succinyltransferase